MQTKNLLFSFFLIALTLPAAYCQETTPPAEQKPSLDGGTIERQFEYITSKSNSFKEYKVVKKTWLGKLEKNITDSLSQLKSQLAEMRSAAASREKEMAGLQAEASQSRIDKELAIATKDSISFLGIQTHKHLYNSIMWGLVLGLSAFLLFFILRYKTSHSVTAEAVKHLDDLKEEFAAHRKKALEREQKLNRRLQDELNKQMG